MTYNLRDYKIMPKKRILDPIMATPPISIPGRPSPRITTPMLSPLRQSGASTSGHVGTPDLHMKLWTQAAGKKNTVSEFTQL